MINKASIFIVAGILLTGVLGCSFFRQVSEIVDKSGQPKTVVSNDNKVQLTVPTSWSTMNKLQEDAILQVAQPIRELYVIVIPDDKKDFDQSADLEFITDLVRTNTESLLTNAQFTEPIPVKVGDFDARQYRVSGTIEKINIKYIFTIVDTPDYYYQIVSWTLTSKFEKNENDLKEVINSFKLVEEGSNPSSETK